MSFPYRAAAGGSWNAVKIIRILEDLRRDDRMETRAQESPTESELLAALDRLDGAAFSSTAFVIDDDTVLSIGGGDGGYIVFISLGGDLEIHTLIDPTKSEDFDQNLVAGGQRGSYPQFQCVDRTLAASALLHFHQHGSPSPQLRWVSE
ncbi:Imm1 family immunity protein [Achromobacter sp. NPDC058515]|uniref:Imm1 family immunity protein n=1 Tax=Achromobacter sp. NPDC058515 TaxID=3346533 RepID=UPI00365D1ECE